jgi:hypothetical protein
MTIHQKFETKTAIKSTHTKCNGPASIVEKASIMGEDNTNWIWEDWLAKDEFHILAGVPGAGKSLSHLNSRPLFQRAGNGRQANRQKAEMFYSGLTKTTLGKLLSRA